MPDQKDKITFDDLEYHEKYKQMGITAAELYLRQNKSCYLYAAYDKVEDTFSYGDLYCTDGKEFALTAQMLNPTFECIQCITKFIHQILEETEMTNIIDKTIIHILIKIGESKNLQKGNVELNMSQETFEFLENHLENITMFPSETKPLKVISSGDIIMFGTKVNFINEVEKNTIIIEPGGLTFKV